MKFVFVFLVLLYSTSSLATGFSCISKDGDALTPTLDGVYLGETRDAIVLETNSEYGVYEADKVGYNDYITLNRVAYESSRTKDGFSDFPIQFLTVEKDDLGSTTYLFGIPLGVFGASGGYRFLALLKVGNDVTELSCRLN